MRIATRRIVLLAAAAIGLAAAVPASAQDAWPSRTISFVCAFPAGSGADVMVRYFAEHIARRSGATIIVENKPGAAGNIAAEYVARAQPDGHTLFFHTGSAIAGNMHMFLNPPIDVVRDLQVVATINRQPHMINVAADSPITTMAELTDHLREQGDAANYAINNTSGKVMAAIYMNQAGLDTVEVRYGSSAESLADVLSGAVAFGANDPVFSLAQARDGRFRILAVSSNERIPGAPDVPTMTESGFPMDQVGWFAVMAPAGTPDDVVQTLNGWINDTLREEEVEQFIVDQGGAVFISTPEEGQAYLAQAVEEWAELVRIAEIPQQ